MIKNAPTPKECMTYIMVQHRCRCNTTVLVSSQCAVGCSKNATPARVAVQGRMWTLQACSSPIKMRHRLDRKMPHQLNKKYDTSLIKNATPARWKKCNTGSSTGMGVDSAGPSQP